MNIRSRVVASLSALAFIGIGSLGFAIDLPSFGGEGKKAPAETTDASASQDELVKAYVAANTETLLGQQSLAEALGLKDEAAKTAAAIESLKSGATEDGLKSANAVQSDTDSAIASSMAKNTALSDESKAKFSEGLGHYGAGLVGTIKLKDAATTFQKAAQSQIGAASMLEKMSVTKKLSAGVFVAKNLPGHIGALASGLRNAISFAQSHKIPVPDDATKALSM